jgi:geranylgeranyl diphosphate synthase, type II
MWDQELQKWVTTIEDFTSTHFDYYRSEYSDVPRILLDSTLYSLNTGGKRFRPLLSMIVAEHFEADPMLVLPWASAVEMIHTYSLIHDDLPCMDDDDERRGKPTNHKVYGEPIALLAGDSLLTEAFTMLCKFYQPDPGLGLKLVEKLSIAAGMQGMIAGQVRDMQADKNPVDAKALTEIHKLKTGQLIRTALEGAAIACSAAQNDVLSLKFYGENLGLAFQIRDDILDYSDHDEDKKNFVNMIGKEQTQEMLEDVSRKAKTYLNKLEKPSVRLLQMVDYNMSRKK